MLQFMIKTTLKFLVRNRGLIEYLHAGFEAGFERRAAILVARGPPGVGAGAASVQISRALGHACASGGLTHVTDTRGHFFETFVTAFLDLRPLVVRTMCPVLICAL